MANSNHLGMKNVKNRRNNSRPNHGKKIVRDILDHIRNNDYKQIEHYLDRCEERHIDNRLVRRIIFDGTPYHQNINFNTRIKFKLKKSAVVVEYKIEGNKIDNVKLITAYKK